jgi:hypothetical protein
MPLRQTAALVALLTLTACSNWGQSKVNPTNWFSGAQANAVVPVATQLPSDPRPLVSKLLSMQLENHSTGVIVRATGLPPTQGYWNAELVAQPVDDKGKLVLEFHLVPPAPGAPVINQRSREITVAYDVTAYQIRSITSIEVRSASNSMTKRP